jgi:predicted membrane-bound dolichyl-phosphate-mannose-protein mannosyltransferase
MPLWQMMPLGKDKCSGYSVRRAPVHLLDEEIRLNTGFPLVDIYLSFYTVLSTQIRISQRFNSRETCPERSQP